MSTSARPYKRSWKNYLIYSGYQLRLTAFMVTVVGVVVAGLGYWVHKSSRQSTMVAVLSMQGRCPTPQAASLPKDEDLAANPPPSAPASLVEAKDDAGTEAAADAGSDAAADDAIDETPPTSSGRRSHVVLTESSMDVVPLIPFATATAPGAGMSLAQHEACLANQAAEIAALRDGQARITWAMIFAGLGLLIVMAIYSIKMTHKVGGPLFKVTAYLRHWANGTYEKIWGLRKGDDLVVFFDHFRAAHQRVIDDQKQDLALAREVAEVVDDPALRAEVEALIARKEGALKDV